MPRIDDEEDYEFEKRGRAVNEQQRAKAAEARTSRLLRLDLGKGGRGSSNASGTAQRGQGTPRSARGSGGGPGAAQPSRETVLKVIGWSKTQHSAKNQAHYVTRTRETDNPDQLVTIENEKGEQVQGKAAVAAEMASWELEAAASNRSKAWAEAEPEDRAAMTANQALQRRQSAHMIFSVPANSKADARRLQQAVREGLSQTIGAGGHRYVFAIHTDHSSRPHAHIVIKARSEAVAGRAGTARQLRLNPDDLTAMRQVLTEECQSRGLDVVATRRLDRDETREQVQKGLAPLRENKTRARIWREQSRQGSIFEAKAPGWYASYGAAYEKGRLEAMEGRGESSSASGGKRAGGLLARISGALRAPKAGSPKIGQSDIPTVRRLDRRFQTSHRDPQAARDSFLAMYREAPKLATWAMNNHPQAFGQETGAKVPPFSGRGLKAVIEATSPAKPADRPTTKPPPEELRREQAVAADRHRAQADADAAKRHLSGFADQLAKDPAKADLAARVRSLAEGKGSEANKIEKIEQVTQEARRRHQRLPDRGRGKGGRGRDMER